LCFVLGSLTKKLDTSGMNLACAFGPLRRIGTRLRADQGAIKDDNMEMLTHALPSSSHHFGFAINYTDEAIHEYLPSDPRLTCSIYFLREQLSPIRP
jgi:hypothetical protein